MTPHGAAPAGSPVPSPCTGVCRIDDASGCCAGCLRSLDEIAGWASATDAERREVWRAIDERRRQPNPPPLR